MRYAADNSTFGYSGGLRMFAWVCVVATLGLIFVGGLVTSNGAGMAVPDWPLSFGSLNPDGWWSNFAVRLEHGHRLFASGIGLLTGILTCWVWRRWWALPLAMAVSVISVMVGRFAGLEKLLLMHLSIWPAAVAFVCALVWKARTDDCTNSRIIRGLALAAFIGVCFQAALGGIRVTEGTATGSGYSGLPLLLAMVHGCVAQAFLCALVALAALIWNARSPSVHGRDGLARLPKLPWVLVAAVYAQLVLGAIVRHSGAGLAIPDFPLAFGGLLPRIHTFAVEIHFAHRVWGLVVSCLVLAIAVSVFRRPVDAGRVWLGAILTGLTVFQISLGTHIIWLARPPVTTTLHVLNGALILAVSLILALRPSQGREQAYPLPITSPGGAIA